MHFDGSGKKSLFLFITESLHIATYGIGGHYNAHYDTSISKETLPRLGMGNRIATLMYYVSSQNVKRKFIWSMKSI